MNQAEDTLLSYIIFNPNFFRLRASEINEDIFTSDINKRVLNAIKSILDEGGNLNAITVSAKLNIEHGFDIITSIIKNQVFSEIDDLVDFLCDASKDRLLEISLINSLNSVKSLGWRESSAILSKMITELNEKRSHDTHSISRDLDDLFERVEINRTSTRVIGIGTGITKFDKFSGGLQLSDLVILAAKTSMGKTSLAITIARNASVDFNVPTVFYSLEMSSIQITARTASMESFMSSKHLLQSKLGVDEITELKRSTTKVYKSPFFIANTSNKIVDIISSMISYILKENAKLFFVDYLQLVSLGQKGVNREQEVGTMARIFKNFAKEHNVVIVLLSQLKRGDESREPLLSDLRDSGQIEEAADIVMFINRPEYFNIMQFEDGDSSAGKAEIIIAKGRGIGLGRFRLNFIASLTKFTDEQETPTAINYGNSDFD